MKKPVNIILSIAQVSLTIFCLVIYFLSTRKMGVMRSLVYRNSVWDSMNLKEYLTYGLIVLSVLFILSCFINKVYVKRFKVSIICTVLSLIGVILSIYLNTDILRSYYVVIIGTIIILAIEFLKINFLYKKQKAISKQR